MTEGIERNLDKVGSVGKLSPRPEQEERPDAILAEVKMLRKEVAALKEEVASLRRELQGRKTETITPEERLARVEDALKPFLSKPPDEKA